MLNWIISLLLYAVIGVAVVIVCVIALTLSTGLPMPIGMIFFGSIYLLMWILMAVFPIIGAVKANEGTAWKYPLSIPFFK